MSRDDDDDSGTPTERLERWIRRRHPQSDAGEIAALVKRDFQDRGLEVNESFIAFIQENATGHSINPPGLYRKLARKYAGKRQEHALRRSMEIQAAIQQGVQAQVFKPSCSCSDGLLPDDTYCPCKVGAARKELDDRRSRAAAI